MHAHHKEWDCSRHRRNRPDESTPRLKQFGYSDQSAVPGCPRDPDDPRSPAARGQHPRGAPLEVVHGSHPAGYGDDGKDRTPDVGVHNGERRQHRQHKDRPAEEGSRFVWGIAVNLAAQCICGRKECSGFAGGWFHGSPETTFYLFNYFTSKVAGPSRRVDASFRKLADTCGSKPQDANATM